MPDHYPDTDYRSLVKSQIEEALSWRGEQLNPEQDKATKFYRGDPFGNEQKDRSQVVSTDVRDAVQGMMPSLMRIFFGPEKIVEYRPAGPEDDALAEQATDYINYVVKEDNSGFEVIYAVLKDALIRSQGIVKWWWEADTRVSGADMSGISEEGLTLLASDPDVEILNLMQDEMTGLYSFAYRRETDEGMIRLAAVPPEEFIWTPSARSIHDAPMVGHYREVPADELTAMGVDQKLIDEAKGTAPIEFDESPTRTRAGRGLYEDERDEATRLVPFADVYVRIDLDGDGISELRHVQAIGPSFKWVDDNPEIVEEVPFAQFCPDPEPHTVVGLSVADSTMDIQRIKSSIMRGMLDSLALSLDPVMEVDDTAAHMDDVLNPSFPRVIRTRRTGSVNTFDVPFVGRDALPVLQHMDDVKETRTGMSKAAAGLDADALQSSTRAAVAATLSAAQQRIELMARIFAETGMRRMYKGLLKLVIQHQQPGRIVRLRNQYHEIDPRLWDAGMDVEVNSALGTANEDEKLAALQQLMMEQKEHIQQGSPLVGFEQLRNTYKRLVEMAGFANSDEFFRPFGPEEAQRFAEQQAQQEQPPTETEAYLQIESQKLQLAAAENTMKDDRERDKIANEYVLKQAEIEAKYGTQLASADLNARVQIARAQLDADLKARQGAQ